MQSGKIPIIDRCNFNEEQRSHFLKIAREEFAAEVKVNIDCVIFDYPAETLIQRCQDRIGHETVTSDKAAKVVKMMLGRIRHPDLTMEEDIREMTIVQSTEESDEVVANILNQKPISARSKSKSKRVVEDPTEGEGEESSFQPNIKKQKTEKMTDNTPVEKATPGPDGFFKIYCDLDGVLADFDSGVADIFNGRHPDNIGPIQLWSGINKADKFYENLPMTPDGQELWDALVTAFASSGTGSSAKGRPPLPDILTGVPRTKRFREEKFRWCVRKLGANLDGDIQCNHVDMAGPKKSHDVVKGTKKDDCINIITCWGDNKHIESGPGAVLIDDRLKFAAEWEKKGGTFIHHTSTASTLQKMRAYGILP